MSEVDLTREVLIAAPYDASVTSTVLVESVPVWFDLGWQKVDGEDYTPFDSLEPAKADTSASVEDKVVLVKTQKNTDPAV